MVHQGLGPLDCEILHEDQRFNSLDQNERVASIRMSVFGVVGQLSVFQSVQRHITEAACDRSRDERAELGLSGI
jgi:hypothetical protein